MSNSSYFDALTLTNLEFLDHGSVTTCLIYNNLVFMPAVALVTLMRLYVRVFMNHAAGADDALAAAAGTSAMVFYSCLLLGASQGLGRHVYDLMTPSSARTNSEALGATLYICYIAYLMACTLTKCCIIASYRRIFPNKSFRKGMLVLNCFVVVSAICYFLVIIFECSPVQSSWNWSVERKKCINIRLFFVISSTINTMTDIAIWVAPLPLFLKIHMNISRKIQVLALFGGGAFACIAAIIRLFRLDGLNSPDITYEGVSSFNWSVVEVSLAIICASVPTLRPLAVRFLPSSWHSTPTPISAPLVVERSRGRARYWGQDIDLNDLESHPSKLLDGSSSRSATPTSPVKRIGLQQDGCFQALSSPVADGKDLQV